MTTTDISLPLVILAAGNARRYGSLKPLAPVGPNDEAVIDLLASDAIIAGFKQLVIVINKESGPEIKEHIATTWPSTWRVSFAVQDSATGTASALLAAESILSATGSFGVANADDIYGVDALCSLAQHLLHENSSCLVGFILKNTIIGDLPVSRGLCQVAGTALTKITERFNVTKDQGSFYANDDITPSTLEEDTPVSMNLWGLRQDIWPLLRQAAATHDFNISNEIRLPDVIQYALLNDTLSFEVLGTTSRCIGVTHPEDLPLAKELILEEIAAGNRSAVTIPQSV